MRQLPFDINDKIKQDLQTIGNNADPKMQVVVARAKSSIQDAGYFTIENIQTKTGLTDISVAARRQKNKGIPDGIFVINLDNGVAKTLFRAYPDITKVGWTAQFTVGSAKAVAICFDGHWVRYKNLWNLITDKYPYIFWVNSSNQLQGQLWSDESTKFELATDVVRVKASRGWKNAAFLDKDTGLVVGYIKTDGKIYYRNYCLQPDGETIWEPERQLEEFTGTAVNLNMFVTNDYRTAFIVEDSLGKIHWFITERNWAGMASPTDKLETGIRYIDFKVTQIETYQVLPESMSPIVLPAPNSLSDSTALIRRIPDEYITTGVAPVHVYVCPPTIDVLPDLVGHDRFSFTNNKMVKLIFNYDIICNIPVLMNDLKATTGTGQVIDIETIQQIDNYILITFKEAVDTMDTIVITLYNYGFYTIGARVNETCVIDYGKVIDISIPGKPPEVREYLPIFIDVMFVNTELTEDILELEENLTVAISELDFIVTEVSTTPQSYDELLGVGISNIAFTVTQINTSPV